VHRKSLFPSFPAKNHPFRALTVHSEPLVHEIFR
jgi:hypothetical protein